MKDANTPTFQDDSRLAPFETLLRRLDPDRNRAGEKYEHLRRKLIKFFEWNSCRASEDLADETFERLAQKIGEEEIHDIVGFAWGIAKNVRQEAHKAAGRTVHLADLPGREEALPCAEDHERNLQQKMQEERRLKCLHLCLQRLPRQDRQLFLAYYNVRGEHLQYRQGIAKQLSITLGALRVRMNRLRETLEKCARQCFASWRISRRRII